VLVGTDHKMTRMLKK